MSFTLSTPIVSLSQFYRIISSEFDFPWVSELWSLTKKKNSYPGEETKIRAINKAKAGDPIEKWAEDEQARGLHRRGRQ